MLPALILAAESGLFMRTSALPQVSELFRETVPHSKRTPIRTGAASICTASRSVKVTFTLVSNFEPLPPGTPPVSL